jgi:hypothetical protein
LRAASAARKRRASALPNAMVTSPADRGRARRPDRADAERPRGRAALADMAGRTGAARRTRGTRATALRGTRRTSWRGPLGTTPRAAESAAVAVAPVKRRRSARDANASAPVLLDSHSPTRSARIVPGPGHARETNARGAVDGRC